MYNELKELLRDLRASYDMIHNRYYSDGMAIFQECILFLQYIIAKLEEEEEK